MFSFIKSLTTSASAEDVPETDGPQNSQNIPLLEAAKNIDPAPDKNTSLVVVGDSALVPEVGPMGTLADIQTIEHQGKISIYVVRPGDTLPQIAAMYDVTPSTIMWANDIPRGAKLKAGQRLVILPIDGIQYTVKKGDTIRGIAKKYKVDVDNITDFNNLEPGEPLALGDVLIIPDAEEEISAPQQSSGSSNSSTGSSSRFPSHLSTSRARMIASYPAYPGYYINPAPAARKTQGLHGYNAVDLAAPKGTPVYAAASGDVILSKYTPGGNPWNGTYGNYVIIQHDNGTQTLYAHMSVVNISVGQHVEQGQQIGNVGSTGNSTGPHLHFEIRGAKNPF